MLNSPVSYCIIIALYYSSVTFTNPPKKKDVECEFCKLIKQMVEKITITRLDTQEKIVANMMQFMCS